MRKILKLTCMAVLLVNISCTKTKLVQRTIENEPKSEQQLQRLISQARNGEAEAYLTLAAHYRDGNGVNRSFINMTIMYALYGIRCGYDEAATTNSLLDFLEKDHPFRLMIDIMQSPEPNDIYRTRLSKLWKQIPAEAAAIDFLQNTSSIEELESMLPKLKQLGEDGSELSILLLSKYLGTKLNKIEHEQFFYQMAEQYPLLYLFIGDMHQQRYMNNKNAEDYQMAITCYYKADSCGMLTPKHAQLLLDLFKCKNDMDTKICCEEELERLKRIADME